MSSMVNDSRTSAPATPAAPNGKQRILTDFRVYASRIGGIGSALVALLIFFAIMSPSFLQVSTFRTIAIEASTNSVIAVGMTFVIISAGIDLSVGSLVALSAVVTATQMANALPVPVAIMIGVLVAVTAGLLNGVAVVFGKLAPFIVTLGTLSIYRGLALLFTGGAPIYGIPDGYVSAVNSTYLGIPGPVLLALAVAVVAHFVLRHTRMGEYTFALGGNREAARLSGVNVRRVEILVYAISGLCCGLGALLLIGRVGAAEPTAGNLYELNAIAAAAIGGAKLSGGRGSIIGSVCGALIVATLTVGLTLLNVQAFWQQIAVGAAIIVAVLADRRGANKV